MATIDNNQGGQAGNVTYTWTLANGDDGKPANHAGSGDRTVQVFGTFGTGGALVIEGSQNGTNWNTLRDAFGQNLQFTAADLRAVAESPVYVRARVASGDGTTSLTAILSIRR
jgi:hypothetical protein